MNKHKIRPIAIYLPQFHPIPENDEWWGKGFTEWTNVVKARPLFKGHYQPHLPADLGFYDLRLAEVREAQAALAKENGIYGFCYYHYWFNGKRILERPFQEVFETGKPEFPFMLCWANENWTRTWDGAEKNILLEQKYSDEDHRAHIKHLLPYFKDKRYIKINGKPVFAFYRSTKIPNIKNAIKIWREEAAKEGIELYLCRFESFAEAGKHYMEDGFNAAIEFEPFTKYLYSYFQTLPLKEFKKDLALRINHKFYVLTQQHKRASRLYQLFIASLRHKRDYNDFVDYLIANYKFDYDYTCFPGITPSWDNSARKEDYFVLKNSNPEKFGHWLSFIKANFKPSDREENFIFINAWNEWAEGNHLEPCQKWGMKYLNALKEALSK